MALIRVALFDPRHAEPIVGEVQVTDKEMEAAREGQARISITAGTDDLCGTVVLPLGALQVILAKLVGAANAKSAAPGIFMPPNGLIKPH